MRYSILFIHCLMTILANSQTLTKIERNRINENPRINVEQMKNAWYEKSFTDTTLPTKSVSNGFLILVDTSLKTTNFISDYEYYLRKQSIKLDTSIFNIVYLDKWNKLTIAEKQEFINQQMVLSKHLADSIHFANNQGQNQVWIINNTTEPVSIQMQDWSYICVLQALTKTGQWTSIQNWRFSKCGNSYNDKEFQPNTANSFLITIPTKGDFETKLRFKLLGTNEFYYSNEFAGKIDLFDIVKREENSFESLANLTE